MRKICGQVAVLQREVKFGGAQFHVVAPFAFGIKIKGSDSEQVAGGRGIREIENVFGGEKALLRERGIRRRENLKAFREIGGETSGEIGTDLRSGRPRLKNRAMADVLKRRVRAGVSVVNLRQAPDVVIAEVAEVFEVGADADLIVERASLVVPHAMQPLQSELRFASEVRVAGETAHLVRKVAHADQHQRDDVAFRLHEFEVVAGIPPSAFGVDRCAGRAQGCR